MASTISQSVSSDGQTLHDVEWEEYCRVRDDPANDHLRMTYLDGTLTIMSPQLRHDKGSRRIFLVVVAVAGAWDIEFLAVGTTTLRREGRVPLDGAGKEPDEGFYIGDDEARVRDNEEINLANDPPPNLAIEVDNRADSEVALPTYARIQVPEVWLYKAREHTLWFDRLNGDHYIEVGRSVVLPRLTPALVLQALDARAGGMGDRLWVRWLDAWARTLPDPPEAGR